MNKTTFCYKAIAVALVLSFAISGCSSQAQNTGGPPVGADGVAVKPASMTPEQRQQIQSELLAARSRMVQPPTAKTP